MSRIALHGLGRIGKLVLRRLVDEGMGGAVVLLNDPAGTPESHALLVEFDSVHGRWGAAIGHDADSLTLNGARMRLTAAKQIEDLPLVSSDYLNDPRSSIVDAASTMVVNGTQVKVYAWYDNEWGHACRLADIVRMVAVAT